MNLQEKFLRLGEILRSYGKVAVAFSGGVDSTFLLRAAADALGRGNAIALTASARFFPRREFSEAHDFCLQNGIRHLAIEIDENKIDGFCANPPDRCYVCKRAVFAAMISASRENGFAVLAEGSNRSDEGDYRPGLKAIAELGIASPLREAGLFKEEIRELSRELGLPSWNKPSLACLASRFVYGESINSEKLGMVESAENFLLGMGFSQSRVRIHGEKKPFSARIEIPSDEFESIMRGEIREKICAALNSLGFDFVSLDLRGYKSGSMNVF